MVCDVMPINGAVKSVKHDDSFVGSKIELNGQMNNESVFATLAKEGKKIQQVEQEDEKETDKTKSKHKSDELNEDKKNTKGLDGIKKVPEVEQEKEDDGDEDVKTKRRHDDAVKSRPSNNTKRSDKEDKEDKELNPIQKLFQRLFDLFRGNIEEKYGEFSKTIHVDMFGDGIDGAYEKTFYDGETQRTIYRDKNGKLNSYFAKGENDYLAQGVFSDDGKRMYLEEKVSGNIWRQKIVELDSNGQVIKECYIDARDENNREDSGCLETLHDRDLLSYSQLSLEEIRELGYLDNETWTKVANYLKKHPNASYVEIMTHSGAGLKMQPIK